MPYKCELEDACDDNILLPPPPCIRQIERMVEKVGFAVKLPKKDEIAIFVGKGAISLHNIKKVSEMALFLRHSHIW